jgi:steroid 5-alpha reductase family enzyme
MLLLLFILLGISVLVNLAIFIIAYIAQSDKFTDITYTLTFILLSLITYLQSNINIYKTILICAIILWATRLGSFLFIRINYLKKDKRFNNI